MSGLIAVLKFIGWRGALAIVFLAMLTLASRDRDRQAHRADQAESRVAVRNEALGRSEAALRYAQRSLQYAAVQLRSCAANTSGWSSAVGQVNQILGQCQAENTRLGADARAARARAEAAELRIGKQLQETRGRWEGRSAQCTAALKAMEAACPEFSR